MSKRSIKVLLSDILAAINNITFYVEGYDKQKFISDRKTIDAVVRNLEIIGEVAKVLPKEFKESYIEIPWDLIKGLRNRIIHEYFGVDENIIWEIITNDLQVLRFEIEKVIKSVN
ncbi:MAG: DUF86 domain-containing protein [Candidatus Pacearchaeota archaeon]